MDAPAAEDEDHAAPKRGADTARPHRRGGGVKEEDEDEGDEIRLEIRPENRMFLVQ